MRIILLVLAAWPSLTAAQTVNDRVTVAQQGSDNLVTMIQVGGGPSAAGSRSADRAAGTAGNGLLAILSQNGSGNAMTLTQTGSDQQALLEQRGDRNTMTAVQSGEANQLRWRQIGNDLPDLAVRQTGAMAMTITQTGSR